MNKREEWLGCCKCLREVAAAAAVDYGKGVSDSLDALVPAIADYEFKVYLVGPFSCGKSTLLNNWMGVDLLPKGIAPETAVATELHYSEDERTVLYPFGEGDTLGEPIELKGVGAAQMEEVTNRANAGQLARVRLYLDNPKLKEYSDVCLVDLPGLSSACKAHELAINQFVMEKSVGIFCVPMPAGTIQQDALEFLQDMERYHASFNLLLTKADECKEADREAVTKYVSDTMRDRLGILADEFHVGVVSKNDVQALTEQLDGLRTQREKIFEERFRSEILRIANDMLVPLNLALAENFSPENAEKAVAGLQEAGSKLVKIFEEVSSGVTGKVPEAVDRVVNKVKDALLEKADGWIAQMKSGGNCNADVSATLKRTVMYQVGLEAHDICDEAARKASREFGNCIALSLGEVNVREFDGVQGKMNESGEIIKSSIESFAVGAATFAGGWAAVGAVIGSSIPVVGTGIGFVVGSLIGGLISAFANGGSKVAENERARERLLEQLEQAGEGTRDDVTKTLNAAVDDFLAKFKAAMDDKLDSRKAQIEALKAEAEKDRSAFEEKMTVRRKDAETIRGIVAKVGAV